MWTEIENKVEALELQSVVAMLEYLDEDAPTKIQIDRARLGVDAFNAVQRRKVAEAIRWSGRRVIVDGARPSLGASSSVRVASGS